MEKGEQILFNVYDQTSEWAVRQGLVVVEEFPEQDVEHWSLVAGKHPMQGSDFFSTHLIKGQLLGNRNLSLGIALSRGNRGYYSRGKSLRLQWGGYHTGIEEMKRLWKKPVSTETLAMLVNGNGSNMLCGEIHYDWGIGVDCWADHPMYGGRHLNGDSPEFVLSLGESPLLDVVLRTVNQTKRR